MQNTDLEINEIVENLIKDCNEYTKNMNRLNEDGVQELNEGLWEKVKYGLSKLGRYKAGGKIFGKGKIDAQEAAQIKTIVDKKGNEVINALDAKIKDTKFPNNEKEEEFLQTILDISTVYDSIVASTKLRPEDKGFLPIDIANGIIEDLATYVKKFLDVDLAAVYSTMDEEVDEAFAAPSAPQPNPLDADAVRGNLQNKVGADATKRDSQRMNTLKSNKLPLVLAGVGTALGALGWLAQTEWLKNIIIDWLGGGTPGEDAVYNTVTGGAADSNGMVHWMSLINAGAGDAPIKTVGDVNSFISKYGAENVSHMFDGNGSALSPMEQIQKLQEIGTSQPNTSVGDFFTKSANSFGDMKGGRMTFGISKAASFVAKTLVKQAVKATAGAGVGVAAGIAGLGSVLVPLGIGLIGTGALVKLMRMKGQKQSRAKTLNDLFQSIQPVAPSDSNPVVVPLTKEKKPMSSDRLYVYIVNLFMVMNRFETQQSNKPTTSNYNYNVDNPEKEKGVGYPGSVAHGGFSEPTLAEEVDLNEGTYLKDSRVLDVLNKEIGQENVKNFELFLGKIAIVRNAIKKMPTTGNVKFSESLNKIKSSPLMGASIRQLSTANADDPNSIAELKKFVLAVINVGASAKSKYANILPTLNENVVEANVRKNANTMTKDIFIKNLTPFIGQVATIFNLLKKTQGKISTNQQPQQQVSAEPAAAVNEQLEKMKHLYSYNNKKRVL